MNQREPGEQLYFAFREYEKEPIFRLTQTGHFREDNTLTLLKNAVRAFIQHNSNLIAYRK